MKNNIIDGTMPVYLTADADIDQCQESSEDHQTREYNRSKSPFL